MALTPWANQLRKRKDFFGPVIVWYHCCGSVGKHSSAERASKRQSCLPPVSPEAERPWERKRPARPYYKLNCYVFVWVCLVGWWWWTPLIPASRKQRLTWSTEWVPGQPGLILSQKKKKCPTNPKQWGQRQEAVKGSVGDYLNKQPGKMFPLQSCAPPVLFAESFLKFVLTLCLISVFFGDLVLKRNSISNVLNKLLPCKTHNGEKLLRCGDTLSSAVKVESR